MYIIGISGGTCSGKTTLSEELYKKLKAEQVKAKLFNMDDYYKEAKLIPTVIAPITRREYSEHNHPSALDLDRCYKDFNEAIDSNDFELVIIEGVFAFYLDEIREKLDLKVYVDLESDERIVRRVRRFAEHLGQQFDEITDRYLDTVRFRHNELVEPTRWHADMVINGYIGQNKGLDILCTYIKQQLL